MPLVPEVASDADQAAPILITRTLAPTLANPNLNCTAQVVSSADDGVPLTLTLTLTLTQVASSADDGVPLVVATPDSTAATVYKDLATAVDLEVGRLGERQLPQIMFSSEEQRILIAISDGSMQTISPLELRRRCRSPSNTPDQLPQDLAPLDFAPMGNYAVSVRWSDGHESLIPYESFVEGFQS